MTFLSKFRAMKKGGGTNLSLLAKKDANTKNIIEYSPHFLPSLFCTLSPLSSPTFFFCLSLSRQLDFNLNSELGYTIYHHSISIIRKKRVSSDSYECRFEKMDFEGKFTRSPRTLKESTRVLVNQVNQYTPVRTQCIDAERS